MSYHESEILLLVMTHFKLTTGEILYRVNTYFLD